MVKLNPANGLNVKQEEFCRQYIVDLNAKQAAIRCGYSAKTAEQQASRLLSLVKVNAYVEQLKSERKQRVELDADEVLIAMRSIIRSDPRKLFDQNGDLRPITDLDDETAMALAGVEITEDVKTHTRTKKYKFAPKMPAIDSALKHMGIAGADKVDATINIPKVLHMSEDEY